MTTEKELNVSLVFNQKVSSYTVKKLRGVTYYVCPLSMLVEGVFTCNEGAVLYREAELHTFQEAWNNKPIIVEHPVDDDGEFTTATTPEILEKSQIGFLLNSRYDKKLKAQAWIDVEQCKLIEPQIIKNIENGVQMEVSTGLVVNCEVEKGKFKGKAYEYIATDYRPDHLAVLMKTKGACSLADGAGLLVMQQADGTPIPEELQKSARIELDKLMANQLTHSRLRELLLRKLQELAKWSSDSYVWVVDATDTTVFFEWSGKLFKLGYKKKGEGVVLDTKDPALVERVTQYRLVDGTVIGNADSTDKPNGDENVKKDEMVGFLIANAGYDETDKAMLDAMDEAKLAKLVAPIKKKEAVVTSNTAPEKEKTTPVEFNWDDFKSKAPKNVQRMLDQSIALMNQAIDDDTAAVVKLSDGQYTEDECRKMDPTHLSKLHKTLANAASKNKSSRANVGDDDDDDDDDFDTPDYSGAGFVVGNRRFLSNANDDGTEDAPLSVTPSSFVK